MPQLPGFRERLESAVGKNTAALARRIGEEPSRIYTYTSGRSLPPIDILVKMAAAMGTNLHWLLTGEESPVAQAGGGEWEEVSRVRNGDLEVVIRRRPAAEEKAVAETVHRDQDRQIEILSLPKAHREQRPAASETPPRQIKTKRGAKNCRGSRP